MDGIVRHLKGTHLDERDSSPLVGPVMPVSGLPNNHTSPAVDPSSAPSLARPTLNRAELRAQLDDLGERLGEIQGCLFEIQELRHSIHQPPNPNPTSPRTPKTTTSPTLPPPNTNTNTSKPRPSTLPSSSSNSALDTPLSNLSLLLEEFSTLIQSLSDILLPINPTDPYPHQPHSRDNPAAPESEPESQPELEALKEELRDLQRDWAEVLEEEERVRGEVREDRWLGVFRQSADSATEMMDSLQKALTQCGIVTQAITSGHPADIQLAEATLRSYEDKRKFYQPSITKAFMMLEKGAKGRMTTNGEYLRRQAEMTNRWRGIREQMQLLDRQLPELKRKVAQYMHMGGDGEEMLLEDSAEDDSSVDRRQTSRPPSRQMRRVSDDALSQSTSGSSGKGKSTSQVAPPAATRRASFYGVNRIPSGLNLLAANQKVGTPLGSASSQQNSSASAASSPASDKGGQQEKGYFSSMKERIMGGNKSASSTTRSRMVSTGTPLANRGRSHSAISQSSTGTDETVPESPTPGMRPGLGMLPRRKSQVGLGMHFDATPTKNMGSASGNRSASDTLVPQQTAGSSRHPPGSVGRKSLLPRPSRQSLSTSQIQPKSPALTQSDLDEQPFPEHGRSTSPALSTASTAVSTTPSRRRSLIPLASPSSRNRALPADFGTPPPVPQLPSQEDIDAKEREAKLAYLRSTMQTPEPTLRARATQMPFYAGKHATPGPQTPGRMSLGGGGGSYFGNIGNATPTANRMANRVMSPGRLAPPSSFREPTSRPGSTLSNYSRAGAHTPSQEVRGRTFVPNRLDELDMELARILESVPNDVSVDRLDPPIQKGHIHIGIWTAQYAFSSGRFGRKILQCRLLTLNKPGTAADGKTQKVMIRIEGAWKDLRVELLGML